METNIRIKYKTPELDITLFEDADIITLSGFDEFEDDILGQETNP